MANVDGLRRSLLLALGAAGLGAGQTVWAQKSTARAGAAGRWPVRDVELTVPFSVGGTSSVISKTLARQFALETDQELRVEYRGGASGGLGATYVAKSPADGTHLLMGSASMVVARALQLRLHPDANLHEELLPLALVAEMPQVLLVNPRKLNSRTWTEMVAELRRKPPRYRYASAGIGSFNHLLGEWLKHETGAMLQHVPYKGSGPALLDVVQGNVDLMLDGIASALPHLQVDRLRPMFITSAERSPLLPDVPTARELGLPDLERNSWYGIFAPQATPVAVQERVIKVFRSIGEADAVKKSWAAMGARWPGLYGSDFAQYFNNEMQRWSRMVGATDIDH